MITSYFWLLKPFPGGTAASPSRANFFCKGGSELHKRSAEANGPCGKRQTGFSLAGPPGKVITVREAGMTYGKRSGTLFSSAGASLA